MKSVMSHDFGQVPLTDIERSTFDRSHGCKTAFDSGYLVPFYLDEVLPGDDFSVKANLLARLSCPLVAPVMDNVFLDTFYFYVPSRLVWKNWVKMMGERVCPNDSIDYSVPQISSGDRGFAVGSLADYLGIPPNIPNVSVNALPFRCYAKIWDDWFRDCNLQDSIIKSEDMLGDDTSEGWTGSGNWNYSLLRRCKKADYFTKCLPSPQMGAGVELPLGGICPVRGDGNPIALHDKANGNSGYFNVPSGSLAVQVAPSGTMSGSGPVKLSESTTEPTGLVADLSTATAATINSLRTAFQIQRLLETDARCGCSRYITVILAHFKTVCPDNRLQRSEYLGGGSQLINISTTTQTSGTVPGSVDATPQGNLAATAMVATHNGFRKGFVEHGYVIGLVNVRADINYQHSLNKLWDRKTRYDFYWPTLAHLGEQAVLGKEIRLTGDPEKDESVFGYQERYADYRYHPSMITGKLRSDTPGGSLDVWHLAPFFSALNPPKLNANWIQDDPPLARCLAVADEPQIIMDSYISCKCTRPMPVYSVPGLVDHF